MKKAVVFLGFVALVLTLAACGEKPTPVAPIPADFQPGAAAPAVPAPDAPVAPVAPPVEAGGVRRYRFAFIPKSMHSPVFGFARIGAERQAAKYGDVEIIWRGAMTNDADEQVAVLKEVLAMGVDGIAMSCQSSKVVPLINEAAERGIPVVTFDSDAPESKRIAFYGLNDLAAGQIMAEEMIKLLGPAGGEIAILTKLGSDNLDKRVEGMKQVFASHPEVKVVNEFDVGSEGAVTAGRIVSSATGTYPNLRGWLSTGGWPGFSFPILEAVNPAKTFVITIDTVPPCPDIVRSGKIKLALGQKYFGWGSVSVRILREFMDGKRPENPVIDSGVDLVDINNVDDYVRKWKRMEAGEIIE